MKKRAQLAERRVRALWRLVAVQLGVAAAAGTLAGFASALLLSWALGSSSIWQRPSSLPLLLSMLTLAGIVAWVAWIAVQAAGWSYRRAAAEIEKGAKLPAGSVQGAVEPGLERPGTSRALVELHRLRLAGRLSGVRLADLGDARARRARNYSLVATLGCVLALALAAMAWLGSPESAQGAWAAVLNPVKHLKAPPLPPLTISAASDRVRRGADLPIEVTAPQRDSVRLVWQPQGEVARELWHRVVDERVRTAIPRVESPIRFWAEGVDQVATDTLQVVPIDPMLLIDVQVALQFPAHTRRGREVNSAPLPVMQVPEGTRATVTGIATRPVERAELRSSDGRTLPFDVIEGRRFRRTFRVRTGAWGWEIVGSEGDGLEGEPDSLHFVTVADSAPNVRIVYPGVDTVLATTMTQTLSIDVKDDYGLSSVKLVSWRVSAWGEVWPALEEPLVPGGDGPRAQLMAILDVRGRGFLPGDTVHYFVQAYDNAPQPQPGRSREYVLRLPTLDEVRERTVAGAHGLVEAAEELAARAREQQESARALDRAAETTSPPGARGDAAGEGSAVEFRETEAARRALEEASELLERAEEIQEALKELQEGIERAGLTDESVLERLREIESLYEKILTPELRERIEALREALAELDLEQIREAIRNLADGSADFHERVEQSLELLRRAAMEHEFGTLETQAQELAEAQQALADAAAETDSLGSRLERDARELSDRAQSLSERLEQFAQQLDQAGEEMAGEHAAEAGQDAAAAAQLDQQAAQNMRRRRRRAASEAQLAENQMREAASALQEGREQMQESWRQEVVEALDRAGAEAMELARRQQELNERLGSTREVERAALRSEEVALKRGLDQLEQQLSEASQSSLLIDPSSLRAMTEAQVALEQLLDQLADGTRRRPVSGELGSQVSEGLNDLAYRLMQAGAAAAAASSGTGVQEALERLGQLAQRQGEVNAGSAGLDPSAAGESVMRALQQLAASQRSISEQLENIGRSMGPRGQVLGQLDAMAREAEGLADQLDRGRLDEEIVRRQGELFQRLLDAGRSLERDEFEKERRAERPTTTEVVRPGELPPELLGGPRFPHPMGESLELYPPAFRRLILEYFDRLNEQAPADGS